MNTDLPNGYQPVDRKAAERSWAARTWLLGQPHDAVYTAPVKDLLAELLELVGDVDSYTPREYKQQVYQAVARTVRLLSAFLVEDELPTNHRAR